MVESTSQSGRGSSATTFQQAKNDRCFTNESGCFYFLFCSLLNITFCPPTEVDLSLGKKLVVVVYNSLGWKRLDVIKIPIEASIEQSYIYYSGNDGTGDRQAAGAYIFHPFRRTESFNSSAGGHYMMKSIRGLIHGYIRQITRIYKEKEHAEVEFMVGPIPIDDGIGKEIITQITTTVKSNKTFYTDSNGRDFLEWVRDYRADWDLEVNQPVAGNYYPINLGIYMQDDSVEFSILVDRSVGGSSIADGELELMLHRRLLHDDSRGVLEALNETVYTPE